jgi:leucyl-tRNA synthetase
VFTGAYAINPINGKPIPVYISDYVILSYGTGAIMAVPAHDQRDWDFANQFNIEIIPVIDGGNINEGAYDGDGKHINSAFMDGLNKTEAIDATIKWLEDNNIGKSKVTYKIREWIFARQRYWGEPIPVVHLEDGKIYVLKDEELPLILPEVSDYKAKNGVAPLENATDWVHVEINRKKGTREVATMPGSAGSSWYFLRYIDPDNDYSIADTSLLKHWLPVDLYIGGAEHTVGHLLYSRLWNNYLFDKGIVPIKEPFQKLRHQGMILGENGEKMSKSRGNVVSPIELIEEYGADAFRLYEMFMGPIQDSKPWCSKGLVGARKFLNRVWRLYVEDNKISNTTNKNLERVYHQTVKKVTEDYLNLSFNTAISQMMIFVNAVYKEDEFPVEYAKGFIKLLNPISPFITEEIWQLLLNNNTTITYEKWPEYILEKTFENDYQLVVQINGKVRDLVPCRMGTSTEEMRTMVMKLDKIKKYVENKTVKKVIAIPNKLVNIVIN